MFLKLHLREISKLVPSLDKVVLHKLSRSETINSHNVYENNDRVLSQSAPEDEEKYT